MRTYCTYGHYSVVVLFVINILEYEITMDNYLNFQ